MKHADIYENYKKEGKPSKHHKLNENVAGLHVSNEPEPTSVVDEVPVDEIKEEPIAIEIDMSELNDEFEYVEYSNWQEFEVEIIGDETDLDELVKEEPPFYDGFQYEYETQPTND